MAATGAAAQEANGPERGRFHFGPLGLTPSIALTNLGVDNNVLNEADNPKNDMRGTFGPGVDYWLRVGPSLFSGKLGGQYLYFNKYEALRSWGVTGDGRWEVPLGHVTPFVIGRYANTTQRDGYEIDAYLHQRSQRVGAGADVRLGAKTTIRMDGWRSTLKYDDDATFQGVAVAPGLNSVSDVAELQVRYKLTPLTTVVATGEAIKDRFAGDPIRDADSIRILPGFEFKPFALIAGSVSVGYRRFSPRHDGLPAYQGVIADVDAKYTVSATQLGVKVSRDLVYSYDPTTPYYALTDATLTVTERVTTNWELVGRGGWQLLGYRQLADATTGAPVDKGRVAGAGIGFRPNRTTRVGFDANYYRRTSSASAAREYEGFRYGLSITYGAPQ